MVNTEIGAGTGTNAHRPTSLSAWIVLSGCVCGLPELARSDSRSCCYGYWSPA